MAYDSRVNLYMHKAVVEKYARAGELMGTQGVDLMRAVLTEYVDRVLASSEAASLMRSGDIAGATAMFRRLAREAKKHDEELLKDIDLVGDEGQ